MIDPTNDTSLDASLPYLKSLTTPGGAVAITGAAAETAISDPDNFRFGYLCQLEAICLAAGAAGGAWVLRQSLAGTTLLRLQQPQTAPVVGTRYVWTFEMPWKTPAVKDVFTIEPTVDIGSWVFICNGFFSSI